MTFATFGYIVSANNFFCWMNLELTMGFFETRDLRMHG